MSTLTVYPDAHPETTSVDGGVWEGGGVPGLSWANMRTATGDIAYDSVTEYSVALIAAHASSNMWKTLGRGIFLVDTSELPNNCYISAAIFSVYGHSKANTLGLSGTDFKINVFDAQPASNTALVAGDFDSLGSIAYCDTPITYDDFSITGYNDFVFNTVGLDAINRTGITKLGIREAYFDVAGNTPTWASGEKNIYLYAYHADNTGTTKDPKLVITYVGGEGHGGIEVVETRFHYTDAYGYERYVEGSLA